MDMLFVEVLIMNIEQFSVYITEKRKARNMTQKDLAEKLNVTPKAVSRWERSIGYPDIENIEPLASALGITVLNLFACSDTSKNIDAHDMMKLVHDSVEIDRKNNRIQEKTVSGIVAAVTLLAGFLFYVGGFGNIGGSVFFGLLSSGIVVSLFYLFSEEDVRNRRIYGCILAAFTVIVIGILLLAIL